jgi:hypothetical protein
MSSTRNFDSGDVAKKTTGEKERCDKSTCIQQIELTKKCSDIIRSVATFNRQEIGPFKDFLDKFKTDMKNVMREGKFITVPDPSKVVPLKVWWTTIGGSFICCSYYMYVIKMHQISI